MVASAVRHFPRQQQQQSGGSSNGAPEGGLAAGASSCSGASTSQPPEPGEASSESGSLGGDLPAEVIGIYDRGGELLAQVRRVHGGGGTWLGCMPCPVPTCLAYWRHERLAASCRSALLAPAPLLLQVEAQQLDPGSATASSARLLSPKGVPTHTVFRTQTPLVRWACLPGMPRAAGGAMDAPGELRDLVGGKWRAILGGDVKLVPSSPVHSPPCLSVAGTSRSLRSPPARGSNPPAPASWWCAARAARGCRQARSGSSSRSASSMTLVRG